MFPDKVKRMKRRKKEIRKKEKSQFDKMCVK